MIRGSFCMTNCWCTICDLVVYTERLMTMMMTLTITMMMMMIMMMVMKGALNEMRGAYYKVELIEGLQ